MGNPPPYHPFDYSYGYPSPWNRELKSGQDRSCAPKAKVHILWPHEAFDKVLGQKSFSYSELTGPALAAGAIATLFHTPEFLLHTHESIQVYLEHISVLFHALSYSNNLSAVLDYHRAVLQLVEAGSITWSRSHRATLEGLRVNFLAGLGVQPPTHQLYSRRGLGTARMQRPGGGLRQRRTPAESSRMGTATSLVSTTGRSTTASIAGLKGRTRLPTKLWSANSGKQRRSD